MPTDPSLLLLLNGLVILSLHMLFPGIQKRLDEWNHSDASRLVGEIRKDRIFSHFATDGLKMNILVYDERRENATRLNSAALDKVRACI